MTSIRRIGAGAMGGGVVRSLVRAGFETYARDIDERAQAAAVAAGARGCASAADLASKCDAIVVLVVDSTQVDSVLFDADGVTATAAPGTIVCLSSTVDPAYPAAIAPRLAQAAIALLDAPVSGGPAKAAAGTMTMMISGDGDALARAATRILTKDAGIAVDVATRLGIEAPLARASLAAYADALGAGLGDDDDAVLIRRAVTRAGRSFG